MIQYSYILQNNQHNKSILTITICHHKSDICACMCVCVPHFLYPFTYQWTLGCLHILAIINNTVIDIGVRISFQISVFAFFE